MSDAISLIEDEKRKLLLSFVDDTYSDAECGFWKKLVKIQGNTYMPEYEGNCYGSENKGNSYPNIVSNGEKNAYDEIEINTDIEDNGNIAEVNFEKEQNSKDVSCHSERSLEDIHITSFVTDIVSLAEDEIDSEFWRAFETKLYGKWLKDDEVFPAWTESLDSINLCNTDITRDLVRNNEYCFIRTDTSHDQNGGRQAKAPTIKTQMDGNNRNRYGLYPNVILINKEENHHEKNVLRWIYRDPKDARYTTSYAKEEMPSRMAMQLKKQFELIQSEKDIVSDDEIFGKRDKLNKDHDKKMRRRSRICRFLYRTFSCFRKQKV